MKQKIRKILIIFCAIFFAVFSTVAYPIKQAQAAPLGLAAGGAAVGGYVLGAAAISAIALHIGRDLNNEEMIEASEVIKMHSDMVWSKSTDIAKSAWNDMYYAGLASNGLMQTLPSILEQQLTSEIPTITIAALEAMGKINLGVDGITSSRLNSIPIGEPGFSKQANLYANGWYAIKQYQGQRYYIDHIQMPSSSGTILVSLQARGVMPAGMADSGVFYAGTMSAFSRMTGWKEPWETFSNKTTMSGVIANLGTLDLDFYPNELWEKQTSVKEKIASDIPRMADAGLVVPVRDFEHTTSGGVPLTMNPDIPGQWATPDGVPYSGDITVGYPVPNVYIPRDATGEAIGNPSISVPTTIPGATTLTPTDVFTGNPSVPIESTVPIAPALPIIPGIPAFDAPGTTGLNFTPLMMTGTTMTNKFPFSIPFDFVRQLQVLNVEPVAPSFNINVPEYLKIGGFTIPFKMNLSFEMFDPIAKIIRWGLVLIFDISLIFAIRKLLPE